MDNNRSELRWGVEQRLEFIEFRLFWHRRINRADLIDTFCISLQQASCDPIITSPVKTASGRS